MQAGHALRVISAWPGRAASWLVLAIVVVVLAAVIGSQLRLGTLASWGTQLPLLGSGLTITGLAELQWHLFAVMVMLGGAYALTEDRHVRVDLLYSKLPRRGRALVDVLGDLIFLLPFCALVAWLSLSFIGLAYRSGEQSDYGGLIDRYLIKSIIPIGLAVLALAGLGRILTNLRLVLARHGSSENDSG